MDLGGNVTLLDYLKKIVYNYVDVDETTALVVLNYKEEASPLQSKYRNYTSELLKTLLSNTRSGSAQRQFGITFSSFVSGVSVSLVYCIVQVILFSFLREPLGKIYQPNASLFKNQAIADYDQDEKDEEPLARPLAHHIWSWIKPTLNASIEEYREYGLDAYFFLRLLKTFSKFFLTLSIVIIPILMPIHYISGYKSTDIDNYISRLGLDKKVSNEQVLNSLPYGLTGLDKISMSNISPAHSNRLIFHLVLAALSICFFHYVLLKELKFYVSERNKVLTNESETLKTNQYVLYVSNISKDFNKNKIEYFCESLIPGSVEEIVPLPKDWQMLKALNKAVTQIIDKIEETQIEIIFFMKYFKIKDLSFAEDQLDCEKSNSEVNTELYQFPFIFKKPSLKIEKYHCMNFHCRKLSFMVTKALNGTMFQGFYLERDKKVGVRPPKIGWSVRKIIEKKLVKLNLCLNKYESLVNQQELKKVDSESTTENSGKAFIVFKKVCFAHIFDQMLLSNKNSEMSDKALGINPNDIVWCNIETINKTWMLTRVALSNFLNVTIIIGWVVPVAFVGFISQIPIVTKLVPIFTGFKNMPEVITKPVASILPAVTLIFLTEGVPFFFRAFSIVKCLRTRAQIELDVQKWFFAFLFVHIFLVVTISSGISVVVETVVNSPINIPHLLGTNLPKCSNFFCSFVLIRGIAYFGGNLLQLKNLLFYLFYYRWFNKTPRDKLKYLFDVPRYQWGSLYPIFSVLASITIIYSVIAPFVLPLASFSFIFVMISFKYSMKYQFNHENSSETLGKFYPQALMQLYSGVYFLEACLIGLFALSNCFKLSLFMFTFMIFTISAHFQISNFSNSMINYLPANLAVNETFTRRKEFKIDKLIPKRYKLWIPGDGDGISNQQIEMWSSRHNVQFSQQNAKIDKNGKLSITGNP